MTKPYTVLLLRPDYIAEPYGQDTYLSHVTANDPKQAMTFAQQNAVTADFGTGEEFDGDPSDYFVLGVFDGTLVDHGWS